MAQPEEIVRRLIAWRQQRLVKSKPELGFFSAAPPPDARRVQQDMEELEAYLHVICNLSHRSVAVEIGLDRGGTHFVWTQLFEEVVSIDNSYTACCRGVDEFPNSTSKFLHGDSRAAVTVHGLRGVLGERPIDHLFIDGDHDYSSVRADFLNYAPLVRPGGIIAFHDARWRKAGVSTFLSDLAAGRIAGWKAATACEIYCGPRDFATGIAYLYKPGES